MAIDPGKKQTPREFFSANGKNYVPGLGCTVEVLYQAFKGRHEEEMAAEIKAEIALAEIDTVTFEVSSNDDGSVEMQYWYNDNEGIRTKMFPTSEGLDDMIERFKARDLNIVQVFSGEKSPIQH